MMVNKRFIPYYFKLQKEFEVQYGTKTVCFMECDEGFICLQFCAKHCVDSKNETDVGKAIELGLLFNALVVPNNKTESHSMLNPYFMGFHRLQDSYLRTASQAGYTVVTITPTFDEVTNEVSHIVTSVTARAK